MAKKYCDDLGVKKKMLFKKKFPGFKKKVKELSVLCGNSVGFICYGPDHELHVWPEPKQNPQAISHIVEKFNAQSDLKKKKNACGLNNYLDDLSLEDLESRLLGINSHLLESDSNNLSFETRQDHLRVSKSFDLL